MVEMLQKEIQSLCNFSFLKIVTPKQGSKFFYFINEMHSAPVKHYFSYLSLYKLELNEPKLPL
jgi:hypothetical protein